MAMFDLHIGFPGCSEKHLEAVMVEFLYIMRVSLIRQRPLAGLAGSAAARTDVEVEREYIVELKAIVTIVPANFCQVGTRTPAENASFSSVICLYEPSESLPSWLHFGSEGLVGRVNVVGGVGDGGRGIAVGVRYSRP